MTSILLDYFGRYSSLAQPQRGKEEILSSGLSPKAQYGVCPNSNQPPVASR
jgi:hypothetical protein